MIIKEFGQNDIKQYLKKVANETSVEMEESALDIIANLADGAVRDALSIFERCILDNNEKVTAEFIKNLVGIPEIIHVHSIVKNILEYNAALAIQVLEQVIKDGKDILSFLWEIIKYVKDILIYKSKATTELYSDEELKQIKELSEKASQDRLVNIIMELSEVSSDIKRSSFQTILLETSIIKLCHRSSITNIDELILKIEEIEHKLQNGQIIPNSNKVSNEPTVKQNLQVKENKSEISIFNYEKLNTNNNVKTVAANTRQQNNTGEYLECWQEVLDELKSTGKIMLYTNLINTKAKQLNDLVLAIEFPKELSSFGKAVIMKTENKQALTNIIAKFVGKQMEIKCVEQENDTKKENNIDNFTKSIDIPINIIEE